MMIKCQKCGFENQLGAIFCRQCGGKLDLEELRPDVKDKKKQGCFKFGCKIFVIMFLLSISALVFVLFFPMSYTEYAPMAEKEKTEFDKKMKNVKATLEGKNKMRFYSFTPAEMSELLKDFGKEYLPDFKMDDIVIEVRDGKPVLILQQKFWGVLRFRSELSGNFGIEKGEDGKNIFDPTIEHLKFGNVPTLSFSDWKIMENVDPDSKQLIMNIIDMVEKFEISEEGNFDIVLKKPGRAAKENKK